MSFTIDVDSITLANEEGRLATIQVPMLKAGILKGGGVRLYYGQQGLGWACWLMNRLMTRVFTRKPRTLVFLTSRDGRRFRADPPALLRSYGSVIGAEVNLVLMASGARPNRPEQTLQWCCNTFGRDQARNTNERAARLVEESIELAQCLGLPMEIVHAIVHHVYQHPAGGPLQELGGVGITAEALAEHLGLSLEEATQREFDRVISTPAETFRQKQATKAAAGIATPPKDAA